MSSNTNHESMLQQVDTQTDIRASGSWAPPLQDCFAQSPPVPPSCSQRSIRVCPSICELNKTDPHNDSWNLGRGRSRGRGEGEKWSPMSASVHTHVMYSTARISTRLQYYHQGSKAICCTPELTLHVDTVAWYGHYYKRATITKLLATGVSVDCLEK